MLLNGSLHVTHALGMAVALGNFTGSDYTLSWQKDFKDQGE